MALPSSIPKKVAEIPKETHDGELSNHYLGCYYADAILFLRNPDNFKGINSGMTLSMAQQAIEQGPKVWCTCDYPEGLLK